MAARRRWTPEEDAQLRALYPVTRTSTIAQRLGRSTGKVYQHAFRLGLKKSDAYLASADACRLRRGDNVGARFRYPKGHVPANKGTRRPGFAPGRMAETQFAKGRAAAEAHNYRPIGTQRVCTKDGYLIRKVTDDPTLFPARRWVAVHRLVWEAAHGPIPEGHRVAFLPGMKTAVESEITLDKLELVTAAEMMRRNTVHNLPKPLADTVRLLGRVRRQINRRAREEQDRGPARSPVRDVGVASGSREADGGGARPGDRGRGGRDRADGEGGGGLHARDGRRRSLGVRAARSAAEGAAAPAGVRVARAHAAAEVQRLRSDHGAESLQSLRQAVAADGLMARQAESCPACRGSIGAPGDLLCVGCWRRLPRVLVQLYHYVWKLKQATLITEDAFAELERLVVQDAGGALMKRPTPLPSAIAAAQIVAPVLERIAAPAKPLVRAPKVASVKPPAVKGPNKYARERTLRRAKIVALLPRSKKAALKVVDIAKQSGLTEIAAASVLRDLKVEQVASCETRPDGHGRPPLFWWRAA